MRKLAIVALLAVFLPLTSSAAEASYNGNELAKRYQTLAKKFDQNAKRFVEKSADQDTPNELKRAYQSAAIEFAKLSRFAKSQVSTSTKLGKKSAKSKHYKTLLNLHKKALLTHIELNKVEKKYR